MIVFMTELDFHIIVVIILKSYTKFCHNKMSQLSVYPWNRKELTWLCKFCKTHPGREKAVEGLVCIWDLRTGPAGRTATAFHFRSNFSHRLPSESCMAMTNHFTPGSVPFWLSVIYWNGSYKFVLYLVTKSNFSIWPDIL